MTCFLRNAFLALVAFATLIVMMAMTIEAAEAKNPKPTAETATPADTARQIVVEEKAKPSDTVTPAKDEAAAEPVKAAEPAKTADAAPAPEAQAETGAPAPEAPVAEAAPAPKPQIVLLPKPDSGYGRSLRLAVRSLQSERVMPGLVPGIYVFEDVDRRAFARRSDSWKVWSQCFDPRRRDKPARSQASLRRRQASPAMSLVAGWFQLARGL
jgi:type IV secretory pathway VirB10-like protein